MADIDYLQTVNIMKAASPYFDSRTRRVVDFLAKALDAIYSFQKLRLPIDVATQEADNYKLDLEGLLNGIRPHCNDRLRSIVDQMLGIFKAKKMYETFQAYSNLMNMMQSSNHSDSDSENSFNSSNHNNTSGIDLSALFGNGSGSNLGNFSISDIQNIAKAFPFSNVNGNDNNLNTNAEETADASEENNEPPSSLSRMIADLTQLVNPSSESTKKEETPIEHSIANEIQESNECNECNECNEHNDDSDSVIAVDFTTGARSASIASQQKHPYFYETLEASGILKSENIPDDQDNYNTSDYQKYSNPSNDNSYDSMGNYDAYTTYQNIEDASFKESETNTMDANSDDSSNLSISMSNSNNDNSNSKNSSNHNDNYNSDNNRNNNDKVIDLLKTMVPPEQRSTLENLSMLFKAMSYDYNNKNQK